MAPHDAALVDFYDPYLVTLSVVIAACASYAALDLAGRVTAARGRARTIWLICGASSMGLGIWSMHYIGMLAYKLPVPIGYDWPRVLLSLFAAVLASAVALFVVSRERMGPWHAVAGSIVMGFGIAAMHYIGMNAMRLDAVCHFDISLVIVSIVLAISISFVALWLAFSVREMKKGSTSRKIASAVVMGLAIPIMHYTGMAAASFTASSVVSHLPHGVRISTLGIIGITMVTAVVLALAIATSVVDRRYSAQTSELDSTERRYRLLFERSLAGVIRTTLDGRILDCNDSAARMLGYASRQELTACQISNLYFNPEDRNDLTARLREQKSVTNYEHRLRRKDGGTVWVLGSESLIDGKNGSPAVSEGTMIDITERKQAAEEKLRQSEEFYHQLVELSPDAIWVHRNGIIIFANSACAALLGACSAEELLGKNVVEFVHSDDLETVNQTVQELYSEIKPARQNGAKYICCDGRQVYVEVATCFVIYRGESAILAMFRDISDRMAAEQKLRQAQKMEAVGRLAGGVAHDFNNLLGVIIGYSEVLLDQLDSNSPLHKNTEQIKKAGERASSLTRQLLAFSRQQVLEEKILDLNTIVAEMGILLRRVIGEDIRLNISLDPTLGHLKADPGQIGQVIMNLAVNARDAMPDGGTLTIETKNINVDAVYALRHPSLAPGRYVQLVITDTGAGMDAQTQTHIFEPFFTTKGPGKGTGLGLATVYGVVKQSGGYIWVYSEPGHGSAFKVYLPRVDQAIQQSRPGDVVVGIPRGSETILVVEDEESLRSLTRTLLEQSGYTVLEADGGSQAIEVASQYRGPIHVLLTDMVMPGMNGRAVAQKLAPMRPEMKMVYMSGYTGFTDHGFVDSELMFLSKPFTRETLLRKLHEVLASETDSLQSQKQFATVDDLSITL